MSRIHLMLLVVAMTPIRAQGRSVIGGNLSAHVGVYRDGPGDYIAIVPMGTGPQQRLLLAVTRTDQLRLMFAAGADTFTVGPTLTSPTPLERRLVLQASSLEIIDAGTSARARRYQRIPLRTEVIHVRNGNITLEGTVLIPTGRRQGSAIIMVNGSEDSDRNSFGPLPWVLAARGYDVVVYDKRGTGRSSGSWQRAGVEPLADDLAAVIEYVAKRRDLAPRHVAVIGTSEGGWVAAHASRLAPRIDAILAISGGARTKGDAYVWKVRRQAMEQGLAGARLDSAVAEAALTIEESRRRVVLDSATATGFDRRVTYDATDDWRHYRGAFLYVGGAVDVLESAAEAAAWYDTLFRAAGHPDFTLKVMPEGSHSLLHAISGTSSEFATLHGIREFVPGYWPLLLTWLDARLAR